jgi:hypothetical protein
MTTSVPHDLRRLNAGGPAPRRPALPGVAALLLALIPAASPLPHPTVAADGPVIAPAVPDGFAAFQRDISPRILEVRPVDNAKHWRQIEPAVFTLAEAHADRLQALDDPARIDTLAALAGFIDRTRDAAASRPVIAAGRRVIGLLDPARGLDPQEITTIALAYGAEPTVFKQTPEGGRSIAEVAAAFLAAVHEAATTDLPATIVVLGHGLPTEIQSYSIPVEALVDALLPVAADGTNAATGGGPPVVDLGHLVLICDDCFSADFLVNLLDGLEATCRDRGLTLTSLPACVAGTNHGRYGHARVGEKFVPHFWKDVVELFYVRRPRPTAVTLAGFFEGVDSMMYGYGRAPIFSGSRIAGWRIVDPDLVQDPIVFVPLTTDEVAELRRILGLPADAPLPRRLDVG